MLFSHVDRIGDWSSGMCAARWRTQIIAQIFWPFLVNVAELPELVRPAGWICCSSCRSTRIRRLRRRFGMDNIVNAIIGVIIVGFSLWKLAIMPQLHQAALFLVALALGIGIHYAILFTLATLSFWIVRAQGLIYGYFNVFNIARYPDVVFRGAFKFIFSWLVPVIIVANVPARILARGFDSPWPGILHLAIATALVVGGSRAFWFFALRRYSSASS